MRLKHFLPIIILIIVLIFTFSFINTGSKIVDNDSEFVDNGTSFDNNNNWINNNMYVTRNNNFTTLTSYSNSSTWLMANYTIHDDFIIEWDNHRKPDHSYCIISNIDKTQDTALAFNDLNITPDCHIKLVVKDNEITPYINNDMKEPISLNIDPEKGLLFRFQITNNGSEIMYSNFKIHSI